jgi:hypothetical protein
MRGCYIIGQTQRTGTNYLFNLLKKHPEITVSDQPGEDWLLTYSSELLSYIDKTSDKWSLSWKGMNPVKRKKDLTEILRSGLINFLNQEGIFFLTKTPSTLGIENFTVLFPELKPIIVIRDGRNTVESLVNSFNKDYVESMTQWAASGRRIRMFLQENPNVPVIKYEDLYSNTKNVVQETFSYLGLEFDALNWDKVLNQMIVGSSQTSNKIGEVDWRKKLKKDVDFNPNERYNNWSRRLKKNYNKICGEEAKRLGYDVF